MQRKINATTQFDVRMNWNANDERRSPWSADAWSRFGSQFRDLGFALKLATWPPHTRCGLRNRSVVWKVAAQRIDYQSGSKHPRSIGCRPHVVVAFIFQRPSKPGRVAHIHSQSSQRRLRLLINLNRRCATETTTYPLPRALKSRARLTWSLRDREDGCCI